MDDVGLFFSHTHSTLDEIDLGFHSLDCLKIPVLDFASLAKCPVSVLWYCGGLNYGSPEMPPPGSPEPMKTANIAKTFWMYD